MHKLPVFSLNAWSALLNKRCISTSSTLCGKKNFRKFYLQNQRGTKKFREMQKIKPHPNIEIDTYGVREPTMLDDHGNKMVVPEMIPEMIVPDLTGFTLKPYVSYRTKEFTQTRFTPEDLFHAVYSEKIIDDWNKKQLNEDGTSKNPSADELLTPDVALLQARKTGSDIFGEQPKHSSYDMYGPKPDLEDDEEEEEQGQVQVK